MGLVSVRRSLPIGMIMAALVANASVGQGPPRGGRPPGGFGGRGKPPILDVTPEKIHALDPLAKLVRDGKTLELTPAQLTKLDSLAAELRKEVAPFMVRIDSLTPVTAPRVGVDGGGLPGGVGALADALAQVELRYQAALQGVLRMLTDPQEKKALKLVEKEVEKMAAYTRGPAALQGRRMGPPG